MSLRMRTGLSDEGSFLCLDRNFGNILVYKHHDIINKVMSNSLAINNNYFNNISFNNMLF